MQALRLLGDPGRVCPRGHGLGRSAHTNAPMRHPEAKCVLANCCPVRGLPLSSDALLPEPRGLVFRLVTICSRVTCRFGSFDDVRCPGGGVSDSETGPAPERPSIMSTPSRRGTPSIAKLAPTFVQVAARGSSWDGRRPRADSSLRSQPDRRTTGMHRDETVRSLG